MGQDAQLFDTGQSTENKRGQKAAEYAGHDAQHKGRHGADVHQRSAEGTRGRSCLKKAGQAENQAEKCALRRAKHDGTNRYGNAQERDLHSGGL